MKDLATIIGQRLRMYRIEKNLSQEKLAELAGCHPTYIGQLERGEKNATIESVSRIADALGVSLSRLFEKIGGEEAESSIPLACYELVAGRSRAEQLHMYQVLVEMERYKQA